MENQTTITKPVVLSGIIDKMKFSNWYFSDALEVSARPEMFVERKAYFQSLREKTLGATNMHTLVFAYPGQGKTVSTKVFFNDWARRDNTFHYIYVDCRDANTEKKIFRAVIEQMAGTYPPVIELEKENERKAIKEFVRNIPEGHKFFLVLDEVDVPIRNERASTKGEWLTVFFRAEDGLYTTPQPSKWHVLMITNKIAFEQSLDVNERQHIQHMGLNVYVLQDIYDIFKKRVEVGIRQGDISDNLFKDEILAQIAKTIVDVYDSNVRTAFRLLIKVAERAVADNTPATTKHISLAEKELEVDMMLDDIAQMTRSSQLFFFSILIFLTNQMKDTGFKDLEQAGYGSGLYRTFFLSEIHPIYNRFNMVNRIKEQKAVERNSQRYANEGIQLGLYKHTGILENKYRQLEVNFDPKDVMKRVRVRYPLYNFDINLV